MTEETQGASQTGRPEIHAASANPEQHLRDAHKLSIRIQGKQGPTGNAVWALVREQRGKVETLATHKGSRLEAVAHFYDYIHPGGSPTPTLPPRRSAAPSRPGSRSARRTSRP